MWNLGQDETFYISGPDVIQDSRTWIIQFVVPVGGIKWYRSPSVCPMAQLPRL